MARFTGLSPQQEQFCQEYIIDLNATQAAIRAGYSPRSASQQGSELLVNPKIAARLAQLKQARSERTQITADRVLEELAAVGFTRLTDLADWTSDSLTFKPSDTLSASASRSVKSVKVKRTSTESQFGSSETVEMEVVQHDKLSALDKLAKHLNLYKAEAEAGQSSGLDALVQHMERRRQERELERREQEL